MSSKYPGGIISKTAPTPSGPYANDTAPGVWTLEQQAYWTKLGQWPTAGNVNPDAFIENLFSTYLYTGNGSTQTITNGIDLSTYGGLVWIKDRTQAYDGHLIDTARGGGYYLVPSSTGAQGNQTGAPTSFNSNGFTEQDQTVTSDNYVSWTFRKQPKFFDVVTFTSAASGNTTFSHNLGSTPGFVIIKNTQTSDPWIIYHTSNGNNFFMDFTTSARQAQTNAFAVTSTTVTVSSFLMYTSQSYVAYVFANNAGGFGLTGTDNVISCGSFTTDGTGVATVDLGYEPQFVLYKTSSSIGDWVMADNIRQLIRPTSGTDDSISKLAPNLSSAEVASLGIRPTSTGFDTDNSSFASTTFIYIAIRRGPMKIPTTGTSVFSPTAYTATNVDNRLVDTGIITDMTMARNLPGLRGFYTADRLRGDGFLQTAATDAEATDADSFMTPTLGYGNSFSTMFGFGCGNDITRRLNYSNLAEIAYAFRRAPNFFDEVCFTTQSSSDMRISHNLSVAPELILMKGRDSAVEWTVYYPTGALNKYLVLNSTATPTTTSGYNFWGATAPSSTTFGLNVNDTYGAGASLVAYLFATCAGVSKVGSYTGTGTTLQVDCGFTGGARLVLIKRTDSTGDWYVWDSARGIVAGNDPYLLFNSTAAEVTGTDYVDTYSAGFEISSTAPSAINASGGTFIFLAIA